MSFSRNPSFKKLLEYLIASLFVFSLLSYFSFAAEEIPNSQNNYILPFTEDLYALLDGRKLLPNILSSSLYHEKKIGVLCRASLSNNKLTPVEESCIPNELIERVREGQPWYWFKKEVPNYLSCLPRASRREELTFYLFGEECKVTCTLDAQHGIELGEVRPGLKTQVITEKVITENNMRVLPVTKKNCIRSNYIIDTLRNLNGDDLMYLVPCEKDKNKPTAAGITNLCIYQNWFESLVNDEVLVLEIHEEVTYEGDAFKRKVSIPENPATAKFYSEKLGGVFEKKFYISGENNALYCRGTWCLKTFLNKGDLNGVLVKVGQVTPGNQLSVTSYTGI